MMWFKKSNFMQLEEARIELKMREETLKRYTSVSDAQLDAVHKLKMKIMRLERKVKEASNLRVVTFLPDRRA